MKLARINSLLFVAILVVNGYIISAPLAPHLSFWWQSHHSNRQRQLTKRIEQKITKTDQPATVITNHLLAPAMLLDTPVLEGPVRSQYQTLAQGIWRWPNSSTPDKGGNTVLIGHRFTYTNPRGVFYYLDKLHVGDKLGLVWNNKMYSYTVASVREVLPTETGIQANTSDARLTLFTCTPLWNPKHRLVVVATKEAP